MPYTLNPASARTNASGKPTLPIPITVIPIFLLDFIIDRLILNYLDSKSNDKKWYNLIMKRYLLTGGAGFIGSAIAQKLIKSGDRVVILDNESRGSIESLAKKKTKFTFIKGDIRDPKIVDKASRGVNCIIHLAYINGTEFFYSMPERVLEVGVKGMTNVLDACIKNSVGELILISSSEVYGSPSIIPTPEEVPLTIPDVSNPRYSYAGGKIISELMVHNFGKKYMKRVFVVRPHNVYGPNMGREHVIPQLMIRMQQLKRKSDAVLLPLQGTGFETRSFIYIDDFADAFILLLKKGKHLETYNIGTMQEVSIKYLASQIAKLLRLTIKIQSRKRPEGSPLRRCPDTQKIQKLGFKPKLSLSEGLKKTLLWYRL